MIYGVGGKKSDPARTALVRAQPEQRCSQYSTDANNNASRFALTSGRSLIGTTLGGISRVSRRTTFFTQGITVSPDTPPCRKNINLRDCGGGKACSLRHSHFSATNTASCVCASVRYRTQRAFSRARAVGRADGCPPSAFRSATPHQQKGGQSDRPSFCLSIPLRAPPESGRNLFRLPEGFGAATPSRLRKPVSPPVDHLTRREVHGDDLGHAFVSMSAPHSGASST